MKVSNISFTSNNYPFPQKVSTETAFKHKIRNDGASDKVKTGVFFTTLAGVGIALAGIAKHQGFSLNLKKILNTPIKNSALAKMKYEEKEIITLSIGSIAGGLVGGRIFDDKKHFKAKCRESVVQMLGNIMMPLICVGGGVRIYNKTIQPLIKNSGKFANALGKLAVSMITLATGIVLGNKVSNTLNEKVFGIKDDRKIKLKDFSAHIDDMCLAITLVTMNDKNIVSTAISRIIPAALMVAGYSTGTTQEHGKKIENTTKKPSPLEHQPRK